MRRSILNLGEPDYAGQIYQLGQRVASVEVRFAPIESAQATYDARLSAVERNGGGGGTAGVSSFNNRSGAVTLSSADVSNVLDSDLNSIAALSTTNFGRSLLTLADQMGGRAAFGLGTAALATAGNAGGNVPVLDGAGKLPTGILPAVAVTDTFVVNSQAAMLALSAERGDVAIRTDLSKSFILATDSPSTLADWKELLTPADAVASVAGLTGSIGAAALRSALSLVIGTDVQAQDADLQAIAALTTTAFGRDYLTLTDAAGARAKAGSAAVTELSQSLNFTSDAVALIPARVAMTIAQGNAPLGTGSVAYAASTAAAPGTFNTVSLPAALQAGSWLRVTASGVTGGATAPLALDLYRSA